MQDEAALRRYRVTASHRRRAIADDQDAACSSAGDGLAEVLRNRVDERHTDRRIIARGRDHSAINTRLEDGAEGPDRVRSVRIPRHVVRR